MAAASVLGNAPWYISLSQRHCREAYGNLPRGTAVGTPWVSPGALPWGSVDVPMALAVGPVGCFGVQILSMRKLCGHALLRQSAREQRMQPLWPRGSQNERWLWGGGGRGQGVTDVRGGVYGGGMWA